MIPVVIICVFAVFISGIALGINLSTWLRQRSQKRVPLSRLRQHLGPWKRPADAPNAGDPV